MADAPHILIVEARFYDHLADHLLEGARAALDAAGATHETATVPGALEIPGTIALASMGAEGEGAAFDGYVALGAVIRGETFHFEIVANESCRGITELMLEGACIGNGILTVENEEQALTRAKRSEKDKGGDAARAALALVDLRDRFLG